MYVKNEILILVAQVVGKLNNAMHNLNHYLVDSQVWFILWTLVHWRAIYPPFEQLGPAFLVVMLLHFIIYIIVIDCSDWPNKMAVFVCITSWNNN